MNHSKIEEYRKKFICENTKVLCTGNPDNEYSIANSVKKYWPTTTFLYKSNGWDLTNETNYQQLKEQFSNHNIFINASYIGPGIQTKLLKLCNESTKFCNVFNIGSSHEYDNIGSDIYRESKLELRNTSLQLNSFRFKTHHLILGNLRSSNHQSHHQLNADIVCEMILWILKQDFEIPILAIDNKKQPW